MRQNFASCLFFRLAINTPCALFFLLLAPRIPPRLREVVVAISGLPFALTQFYMYRASAEVIVIGQIGLLIMMMYVANAQRPRFLYACLVLPVWSLADSLYLLKYSSLSMLLVAMLLYMVWIATALALLGNFWMERHERLGFLLLLHNAHQNTELAEINAELAQLSMLDALTGIPNRRAFDAEFHNAWKISVFKKHPLSVLMIDLDHFKKLNDLRGHAFGDDALALVARIIRETLRGEQDMVARYGGEEFVALLPHQGLPQAINIAKRVCAAVRAAQLPASDSGTAVHLTTSIGVASMICSAGATPADLLRAADTALYKAKNRGRDQVYPSLP